MDRPSPDPSQEEQARRVRTMFARIAPRYDLMNRLMTAGQDVRWRREVIERAHLTPGDRVLDLGAGTGDLAWEAARRCPECRPVATDFTPAMMRVGRALPGRQELDWAAADALQLPFPRESFEAVVSAFVLRNVVDVPAALQESHRVLGPGGRVVALDTTRPPDNLLAPLIRFHLHVVIPVLGRWIAGQPDAYRYLPDSTEGFLEAESLADRFREAGFRRVGFHRRMLGVVAIHWGIK